MPPPPRLEPTSSLPDQKSLLLWQRCGHCAPVYSGKPLVLSLNLTSRRGRPWEGRQRFYPVPCGTQTQLICVDTYAGWTETSPPLHRTGHPGSPGLPKRDDHQSFQRDNWPHFISQKTQSLTLHWTYRVAHILPGGLNPLGKFKRGIRPDDSPWWRNPLWVSGSSAQAFMRMGAALKVKIHHQ